MVLLNYSMVTAISMTKQPSPYHSIHFIYTHHRLWQALESNSSNDRTMGILIRFVADATCSSPSTRRRGRATSSCRRQFSMCGSDKLLEDAAGGLLSPLGPSPLCDYLSISDNSLLCTLHRTTNYDLFSTGSGSSCKDSRYSEFK